MALMIGVLGGCSSPPTVPEDQRIPQGEGDYRDVDDLVRASQAEDESVEVVAEESATELAEEDLTQGESLNKGELTPFEQAMGETYDPVIYFGYDQSQLDEASLATVQHFANILVDNPNERIKLIGHTDERGSQEYNLALGERRAQAVAEAFMLYGVSDERMEIISMGETEPAAEGQTEKAWALNRRVEIESNNESSND
ncbi:hypothetical protein AVO41_04000 [Thiomicrospira sp. WB1]|nr:hypothetical protein AVO41_04000 [Thiomicrospira sp. WB1]